MCRWENNRGIFFARASRILHFAGGNTSSNSSVHVMIAYRIVPQILCTILPRSWTKVGYHILPWKKSANQDREENPPENTTEIISSKRGRVLQPVRSRQDNVVRACVLTKFFTWRSRRDDRHAHMWDRRQAKITACSCQHACMDHCDCAPVRSSKNEGSSQKAWKAEHD